MSRTKRKVIKKSNLEKILTKRGLTPYRLAKLLKRPSQLIYNWLHHNNPDALACAQLMSLLNCSIWDLIHTFEDDNITIENDLERELEERLEQW